jgi:4-hydroxybenzoate polyprenyltransferase
MNALKNFLLTNLYLLITYIGYGCAIHSIFIFLNFDFYERVSLILAYFISFFIFCGLYFLTNRLLKQKIDRKINEYFEPPNSLKLKKKTLKCVITLILILSFIIVFFRLISYNFNHYFDV